MYIRTVSSLSKKTALPGSFSVSLTHFVNRRRLVRLYCLVHRPRLCSFSSALCIVQCPVGTPSLSSFLKRSKDLTLNSDFTELVHGVSSRHIWSPPPSEVLIDFFYTVHPGYNA